MKTAICVCFAALLAAAGFAHSLPAAEPESKPIAPQEVIRLFDGKTLGDTYTFLQDTKHADPRRVFRVTDGLLHITGDGLGSLITNQEYRDYHLVLEFRWGQTTYRGRMDKTKDSGLLIHSVGADGGYNGTWMPSIEVQMIEGGMGDYILVSGTDKAGQPVPLSLTCEVDRDRDGEVIWKQGNPRDIRPEEPPADQLVRPRSRLGRQARLSRQE